MAVMRMLIQAVIMAAIILGVASAFLRKKKVLGLTGILFALAATLLGGASVPINETLRDGPAIGLDWFLLVSRRSRCCGRPIRSKASSGPSGCWTWGISCPPTCPSGSHRS